ncbi:MAG: hypothetical protein AAGB15_03110 [Pseudomonadota bacterium]
MAWAINWALSRPEGEALLAALPEMRSLGPIAGGAVGYFTLAVRQGWGFIVAFANGIWAGCLAIIVSGVFYLISKLVEAGRSNLIQDFETFMAVFGQNFRPLFDEVLNVPLLVVSLGAAAIVGVVTEVVHWLLVRVRTKKAEATTRQFNPRA